MILGFFENCFCLCVQDSQKKKKKVVESFISYYISMPWSCGSSYIFCFVLCDNWKKAWNLLLDWTKLFPCVYLIQSSSKVSLSWHDARQVGRKTKRKQKIDGFRYSVEIQNIQWKIAVSKTTLGPTQNKNENTFVEGRTQLACVTQPTLDSQVLLIT